MTISGPTEAKVGDSVTLDCATGNSNPPASVGWVVDGVPVGTGEQGGPYSHTVRYSFLSIEQNVKNQYCVSHYVGHQSRRRLGDNLKHNRHYFARR